MQNNITHNILADILQNKVSKGPQIANIYINSSCNLKCEYCWFHSFLNTKKTNPAKTIPYSIIKRMVEELKSIGVKYIVLSSHGEPWLHPDICEIINFIVNKGVYLRITTNLTFENSTTRLAFAKANFLAITFSAPSENLYSKIHMPQTKKCYKNLIKNLEIYSDLYKKRKNPFMEIRYIITKNNYKYVEEMVKLASHLGIPQIRFRILDTTKYTRDLAPTAKHLIQLKETIKKLLEKSFGINTNLIDLYNCINENGKVEFNIRRCFVGWLRISLELNGKIGFCCQNDKLIIGTWRRDSIIKSWYSKQAQILRRKMKYKFGVDKNLWKNCNFCFMERTNKEIDLLLRKFKK